MKKVYEAVTGPVRWVGLALSEKDGKPSYGRIMGAYVIVHIVKLAMQSLVVPTTLYDMFMVLVGYSLIRSVAPAITEHLKTRLGGAATPPYPGMAGEPPKGGTPS